jgi:hypothetical protein
MGYTAYRAQHAADDVLEEVEAYGAEAAILKAEVERLLSMVNPRIVVTTHAVVVVPPAPYGSVTVDDRGEVRLGRLVGGVDRVKIEGEGTQATTASVERSCRFDGLPLRIPARAVLETDGVEVAVDYRLSGVTPGFGMRCEIPGLGSGAGMSLPSPIQPTSGLLEVKLPLKNGAKQITNLAEGPGAQILAAAGMSLTGTGILELKYDCPIPP